MVDKDSWPWGPKAEELARRIIEENGRRTKPLRLRELGELVNRTLKGKRETARFTASKERIQRLNAELNPKRAAGQQHGPKRTIGVLVSDCDDTFVGHVLRGLLSACRELDLQLVFAESGTDPDTELRELARMAADVAGIIMIPVGRDKSNAGSVLTAIRAARCPVVFLERGVIGIDEHHVHIVKSRNHYGGMCAGEHLIEQLDLTRNDHRQVFVVSKDGSTGQVERRDGCEAALEAAGVGPLMRVWNVRIDGRSFSKFTESIERSGVIAAVEDLVLRAKEVGKAMPCVGLFCTADNLALATMEILRRRKRVIVPDDVLVLGFDDLFAAYAADLTTVKQDFDGLGRGAVLHLKALIDEERSSRRRSVRTQSPSAVDLPQDPLQVRGTTTVSGPKQQR